MANSEVVRGTFKGEVPTLTSMPLVKPSGQEGTESEKEPTGWAARILPGRREEAESTLS